MKKGEAIKLKEILSLVDGCTVSEQVFEKNSEDIVAFSLSKDTDISPETYENYKWIYCINGSLDIHNLDKTISELKTGELIRLSPQTFGVKAIKDSSYIELTTPVDSKFECDKPFSLINLLPYGESKIINKDLIRSEKMKYVLMSFDEGTGLTPHSAPKDVLLTALEGEAKISYDGHSYSLKEGESFIFEAGHTHAVHATRQFKMSLLMNLG